MSRRKSKRSKAKQSPVYTAVMLVIAVVLLFIMKDELPLSNDTQPVYEAAGEMQVHFIDVGQGDSLLIRLPLDSGEAYKNILIDSGENGYGDEVINYLGNMNISTLDAVIVTHPHTDHMGCMDDIITHLDVKSFYMSDIPENITPTTRSYEDMLDALIDKGLKINTIGTGDELDSITEGVSGASMKVLAPDIGNDMDDLNNCSLIIKLYFGKTSFLFTGDAEMEEYKNIRGQIGNTDVLKVGHHGSYNASDEALIAELSPRIAVISCGKDNDYGHPHDQTVELLERYGVDIHRTDEEGSIVIYSDGNELDIA